MGSRFQQCLATLSGMGGLRAEYTLRASTRAASVDEDKALSVLSPNQLRLPQQLRQLGDIDRDPARLIAR